MENEFLSIQLDKSPVASDLELREWLLGPALKAGILSVRRVHWPAQWDVSLYDIEVTCRLGSISTLGRSLALDFDMAFLVAGAEALERRFTAIAGEGDAGGFAVHTHPADAARNAAWEQVEREVFLAHFLTRTPPPALLALTDLPDGPYRLLAENLAHAGVEWVFAHLSSPRGADVSLCAAFGSQLPVPFGVVLGLGVGAGLSDSLVRALRESVGNVAGLVSGELNLDPLVWNSSMSSRILSGEERFRWGLSYECAHFVRQWLRSDQAAKPIVMTDTDSEMVNLELFESVDLWKANDMISSFLPPPPLVFARASMPGGLTIPKVNGRRNASLLLRLEHLIGSKFSADDLTPFPPPIG